MEKRVLDRRMQQMQAEGVEFVVNAHVGVNVDVDELRQQYDAVILTGGACDPRDLPVEGRELKGVHQAMDYLPMQNHLCEGDQKVADFIDAKGKHVVIIGGGDTGADCLGTANRQQAKTVHQLEIMPKPPEMRAENNPWPQWPRVYRTASAHEEGVDRVYSVSTKKFVDDGHGHIKALQLVNVEMKQLDGRMQMVEVAGSEQELPCDLVLLAMGFVGPQKPGMLEQFGVDLDARGNVVADANWMTSVDGVFTAGDMQRGQSLIVWAIAEGRSVARAVDQYLMGSSELPAPVTPNS